MKKVTEKEFYAYLSKNPHLVGNLELMVDPPIVCWNDFSTGQTWPESRRAWYSIHGFKKYGWTINEE